MKLRYLVTILLAFNACGQPPVTSDTATKADDKIEHPDSAPKQVTTEYTKNQNGYSIAVADTADLPECGMSNDRELAYIKSQDTFMACGNSIWTEVSIKGPQGPKGDTGAAGATTAAAPLSANEWADPVTHQIWYVGAQMSHGTINYYSATVCGTGWAMPNMAQALAAAQHGLVGVANTYWNLTTSIARIWTTTFDNQNNRGAVSQDGTDTYGTLATGAGVICLKQ